MCAVRYMHDSFCCMLLLHGNNHILQSVVRLYTHIAEEFFSNLTNAINEKIVCPNITFLHITVMPQLNSPFLVCLSIFANAVLLPKSLGALTDGSVESPAMHPNPTVGRPPGQRGRKPGRRKTKVTGPWSQKSSVLGPQSIQPGKGLEPIKVPKKRGPKPGSKVGMMWFRDAIRDRQLPLPAGAIQPNY